LATLSENMAAPRDNSAWPRAFRVSEAWRARGSVYQGMLAKLMEKWHPLRSLESGTNPYNTPIKQE
jgi:hypothetical protein